MSQTLAWFQLVRLSALPTLITNVLMAYWLANAGWQPAGPLLVLLLASSALYWAGMVFNDVADVAIDRLERPERPIPSGRIALPTARRVGSVLLIVGLLAAVVASLWVHGNQAMNELGRTLSCALLLATLILTYDFLFKSSWVGPVNMGLCRAVNLLLVMSTAPSTSGWLGFSAAAWWIAGAIAVVVAGITTVARQEATTSSRTPLAIGIGLLLLGSAALCLLPWGQLPSVVGDRGDPQWPLAVQTPVYVGLVASASLVALLPALRAFTSPQPGNVQRAVRGGLFSLPLFDAILCFAASGGNLWPSSVILVLAGSGMVIARWIRPT